MKYTRFILLLSFLCTLSAHAVIGPELIKGFDELIAPQCKEKVSPVYAMGMLKLGTLANIRFWGNYGRIPEGEENKFLQQSFMDSSPSFTVGGIILINSMRPKEEFSSNTDGRLRERSLS